MTESTHSLPEGAAIVNVEAAVYRDGRVLLATRSDDEDHAAGEHSLIGGTLERDADPSRPLEATVEREVREETGVDVSDATYVCSGAFELDDGTPVVNVVFRARHEAGEARVREPEEVASLEWVDPETVLQNEDLPPWTTDYIDRAETHRERYGW